MKPLVYKGLRKNVNRSEWVSSDEIKQSYSQIRLLAVENDTYAWVPIEGETFHINDLVQEGEVDD